MIVDRENVERAFAWRKVPRSVLRGSLELPFLSTDEKDALWFQSRDWRDLTWDHWNDYFRGIFFLTAEALAYYMPSIILFSTEKRKERMLAAESLLMQLQEGISCASDESEVTSDSVHLTKAECEVLAGWLQGLCSSPAYETGVNRARIDAALAILGVGEQPEAEE